MGHHSSELDQEMNERELEFFDKAKAAGFEEKVRELEKQSIGAMGNYPEGKLTEADEGAIQFAVTNTMGKVVVNFGKPVAWLGMNPSDARSLATVLLKQAAQAELIAGDRSEETVTAKTPETV